MKKVLIFICSLFCLFTLVGCHSVSELTKANDELKEGNYTVYYQTQKNAVYKKKTITNESAEYLVKQNGNQKMVSSWDESGNRHDVFTEVNENTVEIFKGNGRYWEFDRYEALENYQEEEILPLVEINKTNFVYEKEVWIGNVELINTYLKDYFNEIANEYDSYKGFIDAEISSSVKKYNAILENNQLSKIEFEYEVLVTFVDETVITITGSITADYSDIYSTVIIKPEGVLELSYAQKPVDNYTADVFYQMNIVSDEDAAIPGLGAQFNMKQDGNKILCTIDSEQVYMEQTEKGVLTYVFDGNKWIKEEIDLEEFNKMIEYPEVGYTAEFFETVDGCYYYGKEYKMNIALDDYFTELEEEFVETFKTEFKDEIKEIEKKTEKKVTITCNAFITEYIIQVVDNVITGVACEITMKVNFAGQLVTYVQSVALAFSDIDNTVVEQPKL